ncbi:MAG: hypothetical protein ABIR06_04555 [Cyclobacteriaceae bacterium]
MTYCSFRASAGFAFAALNDWTHTVIREIEAINKPALIDINGVISMVIMDK